MPSYIAEVCAEVGRGGVLQPGRGPWGDGEGEVCGVYAWDVEREECDCEERE